MASSWKRSLFDGDIHDRLRAYCTPCYVYGLTRYRLERIDHHDDPLDLKGYKASNSACLDWLFFSFPFGLCEYTTSPQLWKERQPQG